MNEQNKEYQQRFDSFLKTISENLQRYLQDILSDIPRIRSNLRKSKRSKEIY